jgi:hypothetical protein
MRRLQARLPPAQSAVFDAPDGPSNAPAAVCAAVTELFSEILRLPERDAGALFRYTMVSN